MWLYLHLRVFVNTKCAFVSMYVCIHFCKYVFVRANACVRVRPCIGVRVYVYTGVFVCICVHLREPGMQIQSKCWHLLARSRTHTHKHTHTQTRTHTHIFTYLDLKWKVRRTSGGGGGAAAVAAGGGGGGGGRWEVNTDVGWKEYDALDASLLENAYQNHVRRVWWNVKDEM